ncbi:uncharacterized protein LOC113523049 [Galleria mellonella]|uniref:Uncharacterized protein LOC113523049 n=1 Tax=Galleria mellonella TaxID=7137 RepID=A0A6J3CC76_GALME|nr:uncharacterized protein LOC113523049 [Galleria mellonella]
MVHKCINKFFISLLFILLIYKSNGFDADNFVGKLRRRESIPLYRIGQQDDDLDYRRTKDIREDDEMRIFETSDAQLREAQIEKRRNKLDKLYRELRWLTVDTDQGLQIGI